MCGKVFDLTLHTGTDPGPHSRLLSNNGVAFRETSRVVFAGRRYEPG